MRVRVCVCVCVCVCEREREREGEFVCVQYVCFVPEESKESESQRDSPALLRPDIRCFMLTDKTHTHTHTHTHTM